MTAIVFDLDGTLIDSAPDIHAAVARVLARESLPSLTFATVRGFIGNGVPVLIERVMAASDVRPDPVMRDHLIALFLAEYGPAATDLTTVYPGVRLALQTLQEAGHPMGICTNKPEGPARSILAAFGLLPFFGAVIGGDSLAVRKPHPEPLTTVLRMLGGGPAVFVGDSEVDAETAIAARIPFALFTEGYRKTAVADLPHLHAFSDFAALPALVKTIPL